MNRSRLREICLKLKIRYFLSRVFDIEFDLPDLPVGDFWQDFTKAAEQGRRSKDWSGPRPRQGRFDVD